jgi:predicted metal-dependent peptidase
LKDQAHQKMIKARAGLILDRPFYGALALRLTLKADTGCKTAWTDGRTLGFDPAYINSISLEEVKGLWEEETLHCFLQHHTRRNGRDPEQWNAAADQVIFHILDQAGSALPADCKPRPEFRDMTAEKVFDLMGRKKSPQPKPQPGQGPQQQQQQQPQQQPGQGQGPQQPQPGQGQSTGTGTPGQQPQPGQQPGRQPGAGRGEVRDAMDPDTGQPMSPAQLAEEEANWKIAGQQAAQQAAACGNLPGFLDRLVKAVINPRVPWQDLLRQFLERTARNDYTWTPVNSRYAAQGIFLPTLRGNELPRLVIAVDTSGSIDQGDLDQFAAEVSAIMEMTTETEITVLYCDTRIQGEPEIFTRADLPLTLQARGGGGTDFRPPFQWIEEEQHDPAALIYLTDMDWNRYPEEPDYPVLWTRIKKPWSTRPAPFGEMIEID